MGRWLGHNLLTFKGLQKGNWTDYEFLEDVWLLFQAGF